MGSIGLGFEKFESKKEKAGNENFKPFLIRIVFVSEVNLCYDGVK